MTLVCDLCSKLIEHCHFVQNPPGSRDVIENLKGQFTHQTYGLNR